MPISGPTVHQQLMDAYNFHQQKYESDRVMLAGSKGERDQLAAGRGDVLLELAEFYLPDLSTASIQSTWAEVRSRLSDILLRQEDAVRRVAQRLDTLNQRRTNRDQTLLELNHAIDEGIETRDAMAAEVETRLVDDPIFRDQSEKAARAESALERAEANLNEIEQDATRKLPSYENSKLFAYLRDSDFGTPQYTRRGLTRRVDRWLARYIGYSKAKQGYDFLKRTPDRMRQIIAEDRDALDTVMVELERRRDEVSREVGFDKQVDLVANQIEKRKQLIAELDDLLGEIDQSDRELSTIRDPRGNYYQIAVETFRDMLTQLDTRKLSQRARETIDLTDDQIVARLEGLEGQIESLDDAARRRQAELLRRQDSLADLGRLIQQFRAAKFDGRRSQFVGSLDVFYEVNNAMESGKVDSLWNILRSNQRWGSTMMDTIGDVAKHPATHVLINAMASAVGGALAERSRRAGRRRHGGGAWGGGSWGGGNWGNWSDSSW